MSGENRISKDISIIFRHITFISREYRVNDYHIVLKVFWDVRGLGLIKEISTEQINTATEF